SSAASRTLSHERRTTLVAKSLTFAIVSSALRTALVSCLPSFPADANLSLVYLAGGKAGIRVMTRENGAEISGVCHGEGIRLESHLPHGGRTCRLRYLRSAA